MEQNMPIEQILPSKELRTNYPKISRYCREEQQPVSITVNGRADTVLMGHTQFVQMQAELELYRKLAQAEEDVRLGRESDADEVFERILSPKNREK